jgi:hypothetical protein
MLIENPVSICALFVLHQLRWRKWIRFLRTLKQLWPWVVGCLCCLLYLRGNEVFEDTIQIRFTEEKYGTRT